MNIMKICVLFTCLVLLLASCSTHPPEASSPKASPAFYTFISKFKVLSLPLKLDNDSINGPHQNYKQMDTEDTLFIHEPYTLLYGLLPDTSNYYAVIILGASDALTPLVVTFDKNGKRISESSLMLGLCSGAGPGYGPCSAYCRIGVDYSIHGVDSVFVTAFDTGAIAGTKQIQCDFKDGRILPDGKIALRESHFGKYLELTSSVFDKQGSIQVKSLETHSGKPDHAYMADTLLEHSMLSGNLITLLKASKPVDRAEWNRRTQHYNHLQEGVLRQNKGYYSYECYDMTMFSISNRDLTWCYGLYVPD
jgi:hypothetical protein